MALHVDHLRGQFVGTFEPEGLFGREVYVDSLTMFVFFLLTGRWLELRLRDRTAGALEALMHRLPDSVLRQAADGAWERVSVRRVRVDDVLRVLPGEVFPADGVLLRGQTAVDEALLTGESTPLSRGEGAPVIAGSHNLSAAVEMRVEQVGADTRYAQIVALMAQASTSKPQIAQLADRLAKPFLIFVLLAAGLACAWWWPGDPAHALMIAVAILVVTCPRALSLATPAAMLASAGALARRGAGAPPVGTGSAVEGGHGGVRQDRHADARCLRAGAYVARRRARAQALAGGGHGAGQPVSAVVALVQAAQDEGRASAVADLQEMVGRA